MSDGKNNLIPEWSTDKELADELASRSLAAIIIRIVPDKSGKKNLLVVSDYTRSPAECIGLMSMAADHYRDCIGIHISVNGGRG